MIQRKLFGVLLIASIFYFVFILLNATAQPSGSGDSGAHDIDNGTSEEEEDASYGGEYYNLPNREENKTSEENISKDEKKLEKERPRVKPPKNDEQDMEIEKEQKEKNTKLILYIIGFLLMLLVFLMYMFKRKMKSKLKHPTE